LHVSHAAHAVHDHSLLTRAQQRLYRNPLQLHGSSHERQGVLFGRKALLNLRPNRIQRNVVHDPCLRLYKRQGVRLASHLSIFLPSCLPTWCALQLRNSCTSLVGPVGRTSLRAMQRARHAPSCHNVGLGARAVWSAWPPFSRKPCSAQGALSFATMSDWARARAVWSAWPPFSRKPCSAQGALSFATMSDWARARAVWSAWPPFSRKPYRRRAPTNETT